MPLPEATINPVSGSRDLFQPPPTGYEAARPVARPFRKIAHLLAKERLYHAHFRVSEFFGGVHGRREGASLRW